MKPDIPVPEQAFRNFFIRSTSKTLLSAQTELKIARFPDIGKTYDIVEDEEGVVNIGWPVGDVRRYGIFPDAFTFTGTLTSGSPIITSISDTEPFVVGMEVYHASITGTSGTVIAKSATTVTIDANASASAAATSLAVGTAFTADQLAALAANGKNSLISLCFPPGDYASSINMDSDWSGTEENPWRCHFDNARLWGILHFADGVSWVRCTGHVSTYDRFGITGEGSEHIDFSGCTIELPYDTVKNIAAPGTGNGAGNRGGHVVDVIDFQFRDIIIENAAQTLDTTGDTTGAFAAFYFETAGTLSGVRGRMIHVRNSRTHGVYINGDDFNIDLIRVDGFCSGGIQFFTGDALPDSGGEAESEVGTGVWLNRWSGRIGRIEVRQGNASPSGAALRNILFDETGRTTPADHTNKPCRIDSVYSENGSAAAGVGGRVMFGTELSNTPRMNYSVGQMTIRLPEGYVLDATTDPLLEFNSGTGHTNIHIDHLIIDNPQTFQCVALTTASGEEKNVTIRRTDILGFADAGGVFNMVGSAGGTLNLTLSNISWDYSGASFATRAMMHFDLCNKLAIRDAVVTSDNVVTSQILRVEDSGNVLIEGLRTRNYNGNSILGVVSLDTNSLVRVIGLDVVGNDAANSVGIYFDNGTHDDYVFRNCYISDFAIGTSGHASATFANISAYDCRAISCAAATDLVTADMVYTANQDLFPGVALPLSSGGTGATTAATARTALGLGTAAVEDTGTSGANVPLLNGANTFSGDTAFSAKLNISGSTPYTIASGVITITSARVIVDTEGAAATDDLDTISGGANNDIIVVSSTSSGRSVVLKHDTGNIILQGAADFTISSARFRSVLMFDSADWIEIARYQG